MRRAAVWIALLAAAGAAALLLVPKEPPPSVPLRLPPAVPAPDVDGKIAYFRDVLRDGGTIEVAAPLSPTTRLEIPVWRDMGWPALLALGQPALDDLTSPARYPEYVAAPNLLVTVLQILAEAPPFEGLFPFLSHWLDERNCPPAATGSDWPDEIRVYVFAALKAHPTPLAVPICLEELEGPRRKHDLRGAAIDILLRVGQADALNDAFRTLPPTPETPSPDLRTGLLDRLFQMAAPAAGEKSRAQVAALEPLLNEALQSPRAVERYNAMAVLWRLGRPGMGQELERFFEENRDDETLAWSALLRLAADGPHPFVHEACLARVERADKGVGFTAAVQILGRWWIAETEPRILEWITRGDIDPYMELPALLRHDRGTVVAWLREEVRTDDQPRRLRALLFIAGERVTELAPDLLARVREVDPPLRPPIYGALVALRAPGTEALLLAELSASIPDDLKGAAAAGLLDLGGADGIARLRDLVAAGDPAALDALLQRARKLRDAGVPDALVPGLLEALRKIPGENGRRAALLVLRFRGRFDDVREGLIEAYRYEPSRRVAQEIAAAIEELAHR